MSSHLDGSFCCGDYSPKTMGHFYEESGSLGFLRQDGLTIDCGAAEISGQSESPAFILSLPHLWIIPDFCLGQ